MGKRLRDPVHGLIIFDEKIPTDMLAWKLMDTFEFQRLRRIRQLGVSEFTFPGAVHSRFAHSVGVFHTARTLVDVLDREMRRARQELDQGKVDVVVIAALLHDLGHGPFSHTFEGVQQSRNVAKRHEQWTSDIIRNPTGGLFNILEDHRAGFAEEVASLLEKEDPEDIYHAIVSSSFDADRLDYLRRDKLMTGTGAGGIDFDWLIENVRVEEIELDAPDEQNSAPRKVPTFCLTAKALPAAEQFLLARYTLHQQVYFHKATRCVEHMIAKILRRVARFASGTKGDVRKTGLHPEHPLIRFFAKSGDTIENYLALDDTIFWAALDSMSVADDTIISDIAIRLRSRKLYKTLDLAEFGEGDLGKQRARLRRIQEDFSSQIAEENVLVDAKASIGIYAEVGGDEDRMHKKLHILNRRTATEISQLSEIIGALENGRKKQFTRVYFANEADRDAARR